MLQIYVVEAEKYHSKLGYIRAFRHFPYLRHIQRNFPDLQHGIFYKLDHNSYIENFLLN